MYKVLIAGSIEYNTRVLESMSVWGSISGFMVGDRVHNGNDALKLLRKNSYDMVITEIVLPDLDGLQLLRHINQEKLCHVVVILSDTVEFQYVRECLMFGAFDYLKKMPDTKTMLELLHRAGEHIAASDMKTYVNADSQIYPDEEERIINAFVNHNSETINIFSGIMEKIYSSGSERPLHNDIMVKKLYLDVITKIFTKYKWLHNYVSIDYYKKLDYLWAGSVQGFKEFFLRKLKHLYELTERLYPYTSDKSLNALLEYILNNPEADLRLKTVAEKVFLNYSYLSSNFSDKLNIHYNQYIVNIKMARAAFLLLNEDMKIYEVSAAVSYQDTNYFTRQFKKLYGVSPSEYKPIINGNESLDYSFL